MKSILIVIFFFSIVTAQNGIIKYKYPNGRIKKEVSYIDNILDGTSYEYYENKYLKAEINYSQGVLNGWQREYYASGLLKHEYFVSFGIRNGLEKTYYKNGALKEVRKFEAGELIKSIKFDFDPTYQAPHEAYTAGIKKEKREEYFCNVDICPEPVGGMYSIQKNLIYPKEAKLYGLEGNVVLIATIDSKGNVLKTKIIRELGLNCEEAATNAVKKTKFIPGKQNGKFVEADVTLSIKFKLTKKEKRELHITGHKLLQPKNILPSNTFSNKKKKTTLKNSTKKRATVIPKITQQIICNVEVCPEPIGGFNTIYKNLEIPNIAKRLKIKGTVVIEAEIGKFGFVKNTKVIKSLGYGCDEAAEIAVLSTQFKPARSKNKEVNALVKILIEF